MVHKFHKIIRHLGTQSGNKMLVHRIPSGIINGRGEVCSGQSQVLETPRLPLWKRRDRTQQPASYGTENKSMREIPEADTSVHQSFKETGWGN